MAISTQKAFRNGVRQVASSHRKQRASAPSIVQGQGTAVDTISTVIRDFVGTDDEIGLSSVYEDMYLHDPTLGTGIDLQSTVPFSDIYLSGGTDKELEPFYASLKRTRMSRNFSGMSVDMLTYGRFIGSLMYSDSDKKFTDIVAYRSHDATIKQVPLTNVDPLIIINNPEYIKEFATADYEYFKALRNTLPDSIIQAFKEDAIELDPTTALFVPRESGHSSIGTSILRRVVPIFLIEKTLLKGTITEATRRQRAITHLELGDGETWIPTETDLVDAVELFQATDSDPISSIVATRTGVSVNEVKAGGDFWKVTDVWSEVESLKMRALGISEAFFSGDYSIERSESAISVYMEQLHTHRESVIQRVLYNKMFPIISAVNNIKKTQVSGVGEIPNFENFFARVREDDNMLIPEVHWKKDLKPKQDTQRMDMLDALLEKGFPITWAMYASAVGISLESLESEIQQDIETKSNIFSIMEKMPKNPMDEMANQRLVNSLTNAGRTPSATQNFLSRLDQFTDNDRELKGQDKMGKPTVVNQQRAKGKYKDLLAKTLGNLSDKSAYTTAVTRGRKRGV